MVICIMLWTYTSDLIHDLALADKIYCEIVTLSVKSNLSLIGNKAFLEHSLLDRSLYRSRYSNMKQSGNPRFYHKVVFVGSSFFFFFFFSFLSMWSLRD